MSRGIRQILVPQRSLMKNMFGRLNVEIAAFLHCYAVFLSVTLDQVTGFSLQHYTKVLNHGVVCM
jgi:hypothetical protein